MTTIIKRFGWLTTLLVILTLILIYQQQAPLKTEMSRISKTIRPVEWLGSATWKVRFHSSRPANRIGCRQSQIGP
jgi:hypothetical protein